MTTHTHNTAASALSHIICACVLALQLTDQQRVTVSDLGGLYWALAVLDAGSWGQLPWELLQDVFRACLRPYTLEQVSLPQPKCKACKACKAARMAGFMRKQQAQRGNTLGLESDLTMLTCGCPVAAL